MSVSGSTLCLHRVSVLVTFASSLVPIELKVYSHPRSVQLKRTTLNVQFKFSGITKNLNSSEKRLMDKRYKFYCIVSMSTGLCLV